MLDNGQNHLLTFTVSSLGVILLILYTDTIDITSITTVSSHHLALYVSTSRQGGQRRYSQHHRLLPRGVEPPPQTHVKPGHGDIVIVVMVTWSW